MSRYWSTLASGLTPYVPGEQPQHSRLVKLNTNESPYPPAPAVVAAIAATSGDLLRRYPDPESTELRQALASYHGLKPEQVFLGNGSDEVLAHVYAALLRHEQPVLCPDISYSFYPVWCQMFDVTCAPLPLAADYGIEVADYAGRAAGGVIIANPNAPTGMLLTLAQIRQLLESQPDCVVVVDEAYIDFGGESAVRLIDEYRNLLVVQTLSKSRALAGMRVGVAMGHADLIEGLERIKNSFNSYPLDVVAQRATLASLEDEAYFRDSCDRVIASRERLTEALEKLDFEVLPSAANFVFARHQTRPAKDLYERLREQGIIVRYFSKPRIDNFLRISIGTDPQLDDLLSALRQLVA